MFILPGYADYVDFLGYLIERCPDCHQTGVFAVYEAKRKLTITFIPTPVNIQHQRIMECKTCGARFSVPKEWADELPSRLLSQQQLSARIRELRAKGGYVGSPTQPRPPTIGNSKRTAYQILQVDPAADQDVIEAAFKRLALKAHPDHNEGEEAAERMRELIEAREILTDPVRRRSYDLSIGIMRPPSAYAPQPAKSKPARRDEPPGRPSAPKPSPQPSARAPRDPERPQPNGARQPPRDQPTKALPTPGPRPKGIRADEV